jgi:hypothetical protein
MATANAAPPQGEPWIPQIGVPGQGTLIGVVRRIEDAGLDEQASDAQHAAIEREPNGCDPPHHARKSAPRPRRQMRRTHTHEHERRSCSDQLEHDDHP